ncbi:MAG: bifunctional phosphoribosylaminoimidazolecarboxamide formyltransferase/IMP cyclohydrolase [Treponema sp.]|nr:bifunctional phosphoribosylaminoimidazolecarboxamide formyltransferase/IMP cyclohydrolase [Treponema sp.]
MNNRALISVYNKDGIIELATFLAGAGWEILSTGGTAKYLSDNKIPVIDVSAVTGFPECLDGRVKTLHPAVHAGILACRDEPAHMETLEKLKIETIDLVCVNLYPFFEKVREGLTEDATIEFIDIGGPAMLRSAAKNFNDVVVLTDPEDYAKVIAGLTAGKSPGNVPVELKKRLAGKVFNLTSAYDASVSRFLLETDSPEAEYPLYFPLSMKKGPSLRYGANSHQGAALYLDTSSGGAISGMEQLHGKEMGFNNIRDMDIAWKAACAFSGAGLEQYIPGVEKMASCVAVKHNTPCGIALGDTLLEAFEKTHACDPVSIFGGIIACTVPVDAATANKLKDIFLEIVIAPNFDESALDILKKKKDLRLIRAKKPPSDEREFFSIDGGLVVQDTDRKLLDKWDVVTRASPAPEDIPDLVFGMRAVSFVKSNAIMVIKDLAATGIGGGQVNRIWSTEQALERSAAVTGADNPARVLASDAFFPFPDGVEAAAVSGIKAIIQPGGSINDKLVIEACDRLGLAMVFTGTRHFRD